MGIKIRTNKPARILCAQNQRFVYLYKYRYIFFCIPYILTMHAIRNSSSYPTKQSNNKQFDEPTNKPTSHLPPCFGGWACIDHTNSTHKYSFLKKIRSEPAARPRLADPPDVKNSSQQATAETRTAATMTDGCINETGWSSMLYGEFCFV